MRVYQYDHMIILPLKTHHPIFAMKSTVNWPVNNLFVPKLVSAIFIPSARFIHRVVSLVQMCHCLIDPIFGTNGNVKKSMENLLVVVSISNLSAGQGILGNKTG